jgi:hypothetical protein
MIKIKADDNEEKYFCIEKCESREASEGNVLCKLPYDEKLCLRFSNDETCSIVNDCEDVTDSDVCEGNEVKTAKYKCKWIDENIKCRTIKDSCEDITDSLEACETDGAVVNGNTELECIWLLGNISPYPKCELKVLIFFLFFFLFYLNRNLLIVAILLMLVNAGRMAWKVWNAVGLLDLPHASQKFFFSNFYFFNIFFL